MAIAPALLGNLETLPLLGRTTSNRISRLLWSPPSIIQAQNVLRILVGTELNEVASEILGELFFLC